MKYAQIIGLLLSLLPDVFVNDPMDESRGFLLPGFGPSTRWSGDQSGGVCAGLQRRCRSQGATGDLFDGRTPWAAVCHGVYGESSTIVLDSVVSLPRRHRTGSADSLSLPMGKPRGFSGGSVTVQALQARHTAESEIPDIVVSALRAALQGVEAHLLSQQEAGLKLPTGAGT
jgi:hypothetical protein